MPSEYVVQREGSSSKSSLKRVTIEQIRSYAEARVPDPASKEVVDITKIHETREYEVVSIKDERGSMRDRNKRYLVEWKGDYEDTWEPEHLLNAPDFTEFHTKKHKSTAIAPIFPSFTKKVSTPEQYTMSLDRLGTRPEVLIKLICKTANCTVRVDQIAIVWASPPCRTFSPADYSNITRNNNFRNHNDRTKPPTVTDPNKAHIAREHDMLVQHIWDIVEYLRSIGHKFKCGVENPRGSLEKRGYMQDGMLPVGVRKGVLDQCVFGKEYRKTTRIWHNIEGWTPEGITGDGRCHGRCGKGSMQKGYFKHTKALAMEPIRGPRGPGHTKEKNALPYDLLLEFAGAALQELPVSTDSGRKVIVDLCAGFQSWAPVAHDLHCTYVAIDVLGDRNSRKARSL